MKRLTALLVPFCVLGLIVCIAHGDDGQTATPQPNLSKLRQIAKPVSISGLAFDGKNVWGMHYHGRGRYSLLDVNNFGWSPTDTKEQHSAIRQAAGAYGSPGGACYAEDELWIAGSYGESIACIDTTTWKVTRSFRGKQRDQKGSQSYSGIAHDGTHLWVAWHWNNYDLPESETQLLLKMDPETGKVLDQFPLPAGEPTDGVHGLTWNGARLWHVKDTTLSTINPTTGRVVNQYELKSLSRPSGLVWTEDSLVIAEFSGKVWKLPFDNKAE